jgi:hypothetical protein
MKITDRRTPPLVTQLKAGRVPMGTVFAGIIGNGVYKGPFLRMYLGIVSLRDPNTTWDFAAGLNDVGPTIEGYQTLDAELVIRGRAV